MNPQEKKDLIENELGAFNIALNGWHLDLNESVLKTKMIIDLENAIESKKIELRTLKIQFGV